MFSQEQLSAIRQRLLEQQEMLREISKTGDDAAGTVELDQTRTGRLSRMDALQAQEMAIDAQRRRKQELLMIDGALHRIADDVYGYCLHCGEAIAEKRLQHNPAVELCIDCANRQEQ